MSGCVFILPDLTYLQDVHNDFIKQVEVDVVLYTLQGSWGVVIVGSPGEREKKKGTVKQLSRFLCQVPNGGSNQQHNALTVFSCWCVGHSLDQVIG